MSAKARIAAIIAAASFFGATYAYAESVQPQVIQPVSKSLQWDAKGHWTLKLDMNEPVGRGMALRDVQAGAYYHLTPTLKVGGAVSFGDTELPSLNVLPQSQSPRVKLETSLKF